MKCTFSKKEKKEKKEKKSWWVCMFKKKKKKILTHTQSWFEVKFSMKLWFWVISSNFNTVWVCVRVCIIWCVQ